MCLHFNLSTKCDPTSDIHHFTLQDGYLIYRYPYTEQRWLEYEYTDLCSAARNEALRWVHITMRGTESIYTFPWPIVIFAVDHDLVVVVRFCAFPIPSWVKPDGSQQSGNFYSILRTVHLLRIHDRCTSSSLINTYCVTPTTFRVCGKRRSPG